MNRNQQKEMEAQITKGPKIKKPPAFKMILTEEQRKRVEKKKHQQEEESKQNVFKFEKRTGRDLAEERKERLEKERSTDDKIRIFLYNIKDETDRNLFLEKIQNFIATTDSLEIKKVFESLLNVLSFKKAKILINNYLDQTTLTFIQMYNVFDKKREQNETELMEEEKIKQFFKSLKYYIDRDDQFMVLEKMEEFKNKGDEERKELFTLIINRYKDDFKMLRKLIRTYLEQYYEPETAVSLNVFYEKFITPAPEKVRPARPISTVRYPTIETKKGLTVTKKPRDIGEILRGPITDDVIIIGKKKLSGALIDSLEDEKFNIKNSEIERIKAGKRDKDLTRFQIEEIERIQLEVQMMQKAGVVLYGIDSPYITEAINNVQNTSKDVKEFAEKIGNVTVYLSRNITQVTKSIIFAKRVRAEYYLPNVLVNLPPYEKLPEIFLNDTITEKSKQRVAETINRLIKDFVINFAEELYTSRNLYEHTRNITRMAITFENIELDPWKSNKCTNFKEIENVPEEDLIYYTEDDKLYCFNMKELYRRFEEDNLNNPYTNKPLSNEFIKKFKETYNFTTLPAELEKFAKAYKPPQPETKIEEEPITGLLKFILEDLQRMELEKSKIVNEEIKEEEKEDVKPQIYEYSSAPLYEPSSTELEEIKNSIEEEYRKEKQINEIKFKLEMLENILVEVDSKNNSKSQYFMNLLYKILLDKDQLNYVYNNIISRFKTFELEPEKGPLNENVFEKDLRKLVAYYSTGLIKEIICARIKKGGDIQQIMNENLAFKPLIYNYSTKVKNKTNNDREFIELIKKKIYNPETKVYNSLTRVEYEVIDSILKMSNIKLTIYKIPDTKPVLDLIYQTKYSESFDTIKINLELSETYLKQINEQNEDITKAIEENKEKIGEMLDINLIFNKKVRKYINYTKYTYSKLVVPEVMERKEYDSDKSYSPTSDGGNVIARDEDYEEDIKIYKEDDENEDGEGEETEDEEDEETDDEETDDEETEDEKEDEDSGETMEEEEKIEDEDGGETENNSKNIDEDTTKDEDTTDDDTTTDGDTTTDDDTTTDGDTTDDEEDIEENDGSCTVVKNSDGEVKGEICHYCKKEIVNKNHDLKSFLIKDKNEGEIIKFCSFECFENFEMPKIKKKL